MNDKQIVKTAKELVWIVHFALVSCLTAEVNTPTFIQSYSSEVRRFIRFYIDKINWVDRTLPKTKQKLNSQYYQRYQQKQIHTKVFNSKFNPTMTTRRCLKCEKDLNSEVIAFVFPCKKTETHKKWRSLLELPDDYEIKPTDVLCEDHFLSRDIYLLKGVKQLCQKAVPRFDIKSCRSDPCLTSAEDNINPCEYLTIVLSR